MSAVLCEDKEEVSGWYKDRIRTYGYDVKAVGFREQSQRSRFDLLARVGQLDGKRILDVGCGLGDFLAFLLARGVRPLYTGVDLCPEMVDHCRRRFASAPAELGLNFQLADTLEYAPEGAFDYVVASGIFGLRSKDSHRRIWPTLERLFSWCGEAVAVNFLSSRASRHADHSLYVDPAEILKMAFLLTPALRLEHAYLPNDFTLYLYRTPAWVSRQEEATS